MMRAVLAVFILCVTAPVNAFTIQDFPQYKPMWETDAPVKFSDKDEPVVTVEKGEFAVVNYGRSELCPGGGFYLVNTKRKTYQPIDAGTCSPKVKATIVPSVRTHRSVNTHQLTFWVGKEISARYPLYDY
ncbi:hypothetical protein ABN904_000607 [Salmonella enterica subsp. enterica serovar Bredeney]|nr:hypothetical protein [Salmonella enterica subsp. enterica serovar Chester]EBS4999772.1 hypothetical protein [Salmonella enterica subsp. enterica serovar Havana]EBX7598177.1 hypothetical protein [Salmonella enterica subsp. enterica serovar Virchow]EBY3806595.1 hypothetical protein [Salmonella enterica subsp. enterica serovar Adabraka]ECB7586746.1 hypothetical protein [Salmonella enterica subsp. enterica serovar Oranienburg]ECG1252384.1 hypothetical protein [Salmonella enterica subsp. enteric